MSLQVDDIVRTEKGMIAVVVRLNGCSHPALKFGHKRYKDHYNGKLVKIGRVTKWKNKA